MIFPFEEVLAHDPAKLYHGVLVAYHLVLSTSSGSASNLVGCRLQRISA